ncbi:MAG TPA: acetylxylan esterase [Planctomycetota bacterium]|nr:acetylxylan esterase [Planctomycetota bacterium]
MFNFFAVLLCAFALALMCLTDCDAADRPGTNSDESKVKPYTLPDPLICLDGTKVTDAQTWRTKRRPELLELFRKNMYGRSPDRPNGMSCEITSTDVKALNGLATRKEIDIVISDVKGAPRIHLLLYIPNAATKPVPAILGVNFDGNHTICADPGITIRDEWTWDSKEKKDKLAKPAETTRGKSTGSWAVEMLLKRGYAVATIARANIEPDYADGWKHGIRGFYLAQSGKSEFAADDWGAIGAWAWGLSRALDCLEADSAIDAKRVVVFGHSRMGKTALWAGAQDERFALVISNDSGEGGAALARRWFGETTAAINKSFPHWFCANFKQYSDNEANMPTDQHELLALAAPRPLYVASAEDDKWADPKGEFLSAKNAGPVYRLFGKEGVGVEEWPSVNHPVGDTVGYHIRTGKHDVTDYDWEQYLAFADRHFGKSAK